ncbi:hypothetical protein Barb7_00372 [Bacteroidales bacterium Barb7]|nr:hypothetical protein Barb7_00372 [Bacteroidales bacterium Barb7]
MSKKETAATQEHVVILSVAEKVKETANAVTDDMTTTVEEEYLIIHHYVGKGVSIEYYTDEKGRFFKFIYAYGALLYPIYVYENKEAVCNPQLLRGIPLQQKPDTKAMKKVNARHVYFCLCNLPEYPSRKEPNSPYYRKTIQKFRILMQ